MSSSGLPTFKGYYGSSSGDQNSHNVLHTDRVSGHSATMPPVQRYQTSTSQQSYNGGAQIYQNKHGYGAMNGDAQPYGNNTWQGINNQQPTYAFQRQSVGNPSSTSITNGNQGYYDSSNQPAVQHSTQALNNLAYASGLESAGLHDSRNANSQMPNQISYKQAQNTSHLQARPSSRSQNSLQADTRTSSTQKELAASAAAALAGVVSRTYQQSLTTSYQDLTPPAARMGNVPSKAGCATQAGLHNRTTSGHATAHHYANPGSPGQSTHPATTRVQDRVNNHTPAPSHISSIAQGTTAQTSGSISNLVTSPSSLEPTQTALPEEEKSASDVQNFVDPSQIFNPYHKEYERQRRAAAEGEARTKTREATGGAETSASAHSTWSQVVVPNGTPHDDVSRPSTTETSQKVTKKKPQEGPESGPARPMAFGTADAISSSMARTTEENNADMAAEMKAMIERMREFKSKDPSMFNKLWEDMRKGGATPAAAAVPTETPSPRLSEAAISNTRPAQRAVVISNSKASHARKPHSPGLPVHLNGYRVVVEDNAVELPDLGRFPAERRYRESYNKKSSNTSGNQADLQSPIRIDPFVEHTNTPPPPVSPHPGNTTASSVSAVNVMPVSAIPTIVSQSVPQPLPPRNQNAGATWPEEKRASLAEAAVKALNAEPENRHKNITTQTIHNLLDLNPSYIDLCKLLEAKGLKFHRGKFARHLLNNVPELATPQTKSAEPSAETARADTRPALEQTIPGRAPPHVYVNGSQHGSVKPEATAQMPPNARLMNQSQNPHNPQSFSTTKLEGKPSSRVPTTRLGVPSPDVPTPSPGSKAAMARKRDFSELVDLTQLSDDEDYVMPSKQPRRAEPSPEPELFRIETDIRTNGSTASHRPPNVAFGSLGNSVRPLHFNPTQPPPTLRSSPQPVQRPRAILARPINKSEALRKSYYDPKTVARDILIAAGRHPLERPLNAHLAGLLHRHIELDSDLSTLDWDAVDPGGPPMPRVQMVDIPAGPPKWKLGVPKSRPRRPPDEPIREQGTNHASNPAGNSMALLSAQTKDLLQESQRAANVGAQPPSRLRHSQLVSDAHQSGVTTTVTPQKRQASPTYSRSHSKTRFPRSPSLQQHKSVEIERKMDDSFLSATKRRGRPPGAKNKHPSLTAMKKAANTAPPLSMPSRPRSPPAPRFDVYDCAWRKCNAKIHNLDTLRKHILRVHRPSTEDAIKYGHTCWWKKCSTLQRHEDKTITPTKHFESLSEWLDHIDTEHLHPIGMEKGDGPSTTHIDPQSIAADRAKYLSDEHGRAVTAPANKSTNKEYAPDAMIFAKVSNNAQERNPAKQFQTFLRGHGNEKMDPKASAAETLRAVQAKKESVGPGMDRGGCTLVNAERRATLLQHEGIARVVSEDY